MQKLTPEEFEKKYGTASLDFFRKPETRTNQGSLQERLATIGQGAADNISSAIKGEDEFEGQSPISRGFSATADAFGVVPKAAVEFAPEPVRKVVSTIGEKIGKLFKKGTDKLASTKLFEEIGNLEAQGFINKENAPELYAIREALGVGSDAGEIAGTVLAAKGLETGATKTGTILKKAGDNIVDGIDDAQRAVAPVVDKITDFGSDAMGAAKGFVDRVKKVPDNVATNLAESAAKTEAIKALPLKTAQEAAESGIDIPDVETVLKVASKQNPKMSELSKTLYQGVKDFAAGKTKVDPIEIVGRPIVQRLKTLDAGREKVGQALGQVSEKLGKVTTKEIAPIVFKELKSVNGLGGLKVNNKGVLDFKDTVLSSSLTKADRMAIQKIFTESIKAGSGKSKHLFRQELFEILDGKKKNLSVNLTGTQEKAYQAVRTGLSNVLEGKNSRYKTLSNQYRKLIQPITELRKRMKAFDPNIDEDILDMKAGLLARRLTSAAQSNPDIRLLLRAMDKATEKAGKTTVSVEELQDLYNVFDRYYDITPKTGFQGQIKNAINGPSGIFDTVKKIATDFGGETAAVRQKALEKIFNELF